MGKYAYNKESPVKDESKKVLETKLENEDSEDLNNEEIFGDEDSDNSDF